MFGEEIVTQYRSNNPLRSAQGDVDFWSSTCGGG
jgi:hypothetical protein